MGPKSEETASPGCVVCGKLVPTVFVVSMLIIGRKLVFRTAINVVILDAFSIEFPLGAGCHITLIS